MDNISIEATETADDEKRIKNPHTALKLTSIIMACLLIGGVVFSADFFAKDFGGRYAYRAIQKEVSQTYQNHSGTIAEDPVTKTMPQNADTVRYKESYLLRLSLLQESMEKQSSSEVKDKSDFSKVLTEYKNKLNNLNMTFNAGASFDEVFANDKYDAGSNPNTYSSSYYSDMEKEAREIIVPDNLIDYKNVSESVASVFDIEVKYGFRSMDESCKRDEKGRDNLNNALGAFCTSDPRSIYLSDARDMSYNYSSAFLVDATKHEIAHRLIYQVCGTIRPNIADGQNERVTSSYAVLFLGADYERLQTMTREDSDYKMTDESHKVARAIHDNTNCNGNQ